MSQGANEEGNSGEESVADTPEMSSAAGQAWVGADATHHTFRKDGFQNKSEIAIAIAVDDRSQFNTKYRSVIESKCNEYGTSLTRPVLKSHAVKSIASEWEYDEILSDFVEELLTISCISNIHVVVTTITNQMVEAYEEGGGPREMISREDLHSEITNYYPLIAVWDYLDEYRDAPWGTANVLLDDFEGKDNIPWRRTGAISDDLYVIPQGDATYPLLSLADLTMDYVKENAEEWTEESIEDALIEATPDDSAYVNTKGLHRPAEISEIVPISRRNINRAKHYPHPIVFIDRAGINRERLTDYEIYHVISEHIYEKSGCMKFFSESEDGGVVGPDDYIVCLDESDVSKYKKYEKYNNRDNVILTPENVFDELG